MDEIKPVENPEKHIDSEYFPNWIEAFEEHDLTVDRYVIATLTMHFPLSKVKMRTAIGHAIEKSRHQNLCEPDLALIVAGVRKVMLAE